MITNKADNTKRAELLAKIFIEDTGKFDIISSFDDKYDFIIVGKGWTNTQKIGVDVKASRYSLSQIRDKYASHIKTNRNKQNLIFFIDYINKKGWILYRDGRKSTGLFKMEKSLFMEKLNLND